MRQGWLESEPSALQEEGLIPSLVAPDPSLGKLRRIQPAGDRPWVDACLLRDLQLGLTLTVQCMHFHVSLVSRLSASLTPPLQPTSVYHSCFPRLRLWPVAFEQPAMQMRNTISTMAMPFVTILSQANESSGEPIRRPCGVTIPANRRGSTSREFSEKVTSGSRNTQSSTRGDRHTQ